MITPQIDFSARLGRPRDQGRRPTCLVFAGSDLNAEAAGTDHLSAEYLCHHAAKLAEHWQPGHGFQMDHVLGALRTPGQPSEEHYPYQPDNQEAPLTVPGGEFALISAATARRQDMTIDDVVTHIASMKPVGLVVQVCQALMAPKGGIIDFDPLVLPDQYHALIGVGLGVDQDSGERHLLVRNSWGEFWGAAGHAWIPISLLEILLVEGFLI